MKEQKETEKTFFKFKNLKDSIEGRVVSLIQTQLGGALELEINQDEHVYLGINTVGLKRIFKQAFLRKDIIIGQTVLSVMFIEETPLKNNPQNTFCHYLLQGYRVPDKKESFFRYSTKEYEIIDESEFIKFLD